MPAVTYYVALAFKRSEEDGNIVAWDPKEVRSAEEAIKMACLVGHNGRTLRSHSVFAHW